MFGGGRTSGTERERSRRRLTNRTTAEKLYAFTENLAHRILSFKIYCRDGCVNIISQEVIFRLKEFIS